jgi:hypothetical protein
MKHSHLILTAVLAAIPLTSSDVISAGDLLISEFRLRGPTVAKDEFVEIYNTTNSVITVARTVIFNGTVIHGGGERAVHPIGI